jgi:hypothetical protein
MKRTFKKLVAAFAIMAAFTSISNAQDAPKADKMQPKKEGMHEGKHEGEGNHEGKMGDWKELNAFHNMLSQTFHPMDEGNFEPIKKQAGELLSRAKALQASKIPASVKNADEAKSLTTSLANQCQNIAELVQKNSSDDLIKPVMVELHNNFHKLLGMVNGEGKEKPAKKAQAKKSGK